jgi:hypothetical protein
MMDGRKSHHNTAQAKAHGSVESDFPRLINQHSYSLHLYI